MNHENQPLEQAIRDSLNQRVRQLDAASLSRLNRGRQAALAQLDRPRWSGWLSRLQWQSLPMAAASMALLLLLLLPLQLSQPQAPQLLPSDASIFALDEGFDYYDELEFGEWLDQGAPLASAMPE